jgi:hypothetical protein
MSTSVSAHRPRTYHAVVPRSVRARSEISTQVPTGVTAFHDVTSSVNAKPGVTSGDVQEASSHGRAGSSRCGSSYSRRPEGRSIRSAPCVTVVPS